MINPASVKETYCWALGQNQRRCDSVVTHTKIYFDTPTLELAQSTNSVALTAQRSGQLSLIWKSIRPSTLSISAREKIERMFALSHTDELILALEKLSSLMELKTLLQPILSLTATRHYRVIRPDGPMVHISLDAIIGKVAKQKPHCANFLELELNGQTTSDLFSRTVHRISRRTPEINPIESKYKHFMTVLNGEGVCCA